MNWPQPFSRPVSSWCPVFLSEYRTRSMEKFASTCELLLCLVQAWSLQLFIVLTEFFLFTCVTLEALPAMSTPLSASSLLSLEGSVFSWLSGCLVAYRLRSLMISRKIMMFIEVLPVKKSSILFSFLYPSRT